MTRSMTETTFPQTIGEHYSQGQWMYIKYTHMYIKYMIY